MIDVLKECVHHAAYSEVIYSCGYHVSMNEGSEVSGCIIILNIDRFIEGLWVKFLVD